MQKAIITAVVAVIIGGGAYLVLHKNSDKDSKKSNSQTSQPSYPSDSSAQASTDNNNQSAATTITYADSGFSPSTVSVKAGDTVAIKNTSSRDMQFDSDPHPSHTDDEDLNVGIISPGQTMTFKAEKTGSHGYHNHLNPSDTGTIVVQ